MKCQNKETGQIVGIKTYRYNDHVVAKHLIRILKKCKQNSNIMDFQDVFKRKKRICIVLEFLPRRLLSLIKENRTGIDEQYVKLLMYQLLNALKEVHANEIVHRDIKPEKILLKDGDVHVKLGGFGLARRAESGMTPHVTTSWYRAPEVICEGDYGCPIDIWAAGLVMGELLNAKPLLPGESEADVLSLVQHVIGGLSTAQKRYIQKKKIQLSSASSTRHVPLEKRYRDKLSKPGMQLLKSMLKCDPNERPSASKCLESSWFDDINVEKLMKRYFNQCNAQSSHATTSQAQSSHAYNSHQQNPHSHARNSHPNTKSTQHSSRSKRRLPVRINGNHKIQIGTNANHVTITLHRIPRVKATDKTKYKLPSLGMIPIHRVDDYLDTVPSEWKKLGGIFVPLYQSEALQLCFEYHCKESDGSSPQPSRAVKVAYGSINAISGNAWKRDSKHPSDHLFVQPHGKASLEGVLNDNNDFHQFCSSQLSGDIDISHDGSETMQIVMYETKLTVQASTHDYAKGNPSQQQGPQQYSGHPQRDPRSGVLPNIKRDSSTGKIRGRRKKGLSKYEILETVGEGTYGVVMKARDRESNCIVAIKKFKDSEYDDEAVRKTTQREKKILKMLKQGNIIQMKENFKRKGKMYLVFEYVPKNLLEVLEEHEHGFDPELIRVYMYQIIKAIEYCHNADIIHRDVKLENLLLHPDHTLKLCDFGFARTVSKNNTETPYVSTRWYRAPELLVNAKYGKPVDIWAIGCIMGEITDGKPLFPGTTDLDQLFLIQNIDGEVPSSHIEAFYQKYSNYKFPKRSGKPLNIKERYGKKLDDVAIDFMQQLLRLDPNERPNASTLLKHPYFDGFDVEDFIHTQQQQLEEEAKDLQVTGDPSELPKLLTNWNQGSARPSQDNFQDNLSMKPPIGGGQNAHTPGAHSPSPIKKQSTQGQIPLPKQKTPRSKNERLFTKLSKQDSFSTPKLNNRRRSSVATPDELQITNSFQKPPSRSSSRQSSRKGSRNRKRGPPQENRPPLPTPTQKAAQPKYETVIDFSKFGRFYIHIVNSEQYKLITGFDPSHDPFETSVYEQLGIPWYEEYSETTLDISDDVLSQIGFIKPKGI